MKRFMFLLAFALIPFAIQAQEEVEMADSMRSSGKIYVVVAIVLTVLVGLIGYLVMLDQKITKAEKQLKS